MREDWSTLRKLMFQHMAGGCALSEYEITGNPVAFNTNVQKPLSVFTIPFLPVQSGTGDPSPENIQTISGLAGFTAYRGADQTDYDSYPVTFPETIYGGTLDAVNGVLTVTHMNFITTWGAGTNKAVLGEYERRKYTLPQTNTQASNIQGSRYCNVAKWWWDYDTDGVSHFYIGGNSAYVILPVGTSDSQEIQIVGELATPYEIPLSDVSVPVTLKGDNTIWTNTNGSNTIKYKKKG